MDTEKRELWDRLENESERAHGAFECFLSLPGGERTLLGAYRQHVGNPEAAKPSDTWSGWSSQFAWRERAAAYDDHLASLRRDAYERAMEWLENAQPSDLRFQDVVHIIRLHMDYLKAFPVQPEPRNEDDWTEEDDADLERIIREIEARRDLEEGAQDPDEEVSESDGSDEDNDDSENPENNPDYR